MKQISKIMIFVGFVKKRSNKVRNQCRLTGKYRDSAQQNCKFNVTQKQNSFIPFAFQTLSTYDLQIFFKNLFDKKKDKIELKVLPETSEEYTSVL